MSINESGLNWYLYIAFHFLSSIELNFLPTKKKMYTSCQLDDEPSKLEFKLLVKILTKLLLEPMLFLLLLSLLLLFVILVYLLVLLHSLLISFNIIGCRIIYTIFYNTINIIIIVVTN